MYLSALHDQMHSKIMRHTYICQMSPAYPRYVLIDTSVKIIYSKTDKQYINILHAPNRTWGYKAII